MKRLIYLLLLSFPISLFAQVGSFKFPSSVQGWQFVGQEGFSDGEINTPGFALSPSGEPYVGIQDAGGAFKASVLKFDGTSWTYVGNQGFSDTTAILVSIKFNSLGEPVVLILDGTLSLTVMKFNGTQWEHIGNPQFTRAGSISLAISPTDVPYVAFEDLGGISVMKYDSNQWVYVGPRTFVSYATHPSLAISASGVPYLAFIDYLFLNGCTVMEFISGNWVLVGPRPLTAAAEFVQIRFSPSGILYIASDGNHLQQANVRKLLGDYYWVTVGAPIISEGRAFRVRIAFSPSGDPYISYSDWTNECWRKATVKKFDSTWTNVGTRGFTPDEAEGIGIEVNQAGVPYVAFIDYADSAKASVMMFDYPVGLPAHPAFDLKVYQDPVENMINIEFNAQSNSGRSIYIYNFLGEKIFETVFSGKLKMIDAENLPPGIYFVKVVEEDIFRVSRFYKK